MVMMSGWHDLMTGAMKRVMFTATQEVLLVESVNVDEDKEVEPGRHIDAVDSGPRTSRV